MATLAEEIQACILSSFFFDHVMTFERFHRKFPRFQEWLENLEANKSVIVHIFPPAPHPTTAKRWDRFNKYMRSDEGEECLALFQHWPKYAKLCIERCNLCYLKDEGDAEERYRVDRMYMLMRCTGEAREAMAERYFENYDRYLFKEERKRKRLVDDVGGFLESPEESQGSV